MAKDDLFDKLGDFVKKGTQNIRDRLIMDVTDLIRAIDKSDAEEVARALNAGVDPDELDGASRRALPIAVDNNHFEIVILLLKAGADPNLPGKTGDTPLFKSVYWENQQITRALLTAGADAHQKTRQGISPMEEAKKNGYEKIVVLLEEFQGEKRARQVKEDRAKHEALKEKAKKVRTERKEKEERRIAAEQKRIDKANQRMAERAAKRVLKKYKVNEAKPIPSLLSMLQEKDTESAKIFFDRFKDELGNDDENQNVALLEAIRQENSEMTRLLIDNGANCLVKVKGSEHSALSFSVSKNAHKLVQYILSQNKEAAPDFLNNPKQLISLQFLAYKDAKMLDILLTAGANPFFGGTAGLSPIANAIEKASIAILPVLAKHKIDLDTRIDGRTPLELAIHHDKMDWVNGLLAEGVDTSLKDEKGRTPKQLAEELGRIEIAKLL